MPRVRLALLAFALLPRFVTAQAPFTRVAASSLRFSATPPPATYATARAFPSLSFTQPVALVTPPGETRRLFVVEKTGRIWVVPDVTAASPTRILFLDLSERVATGGGTDERGLLALAFHPNYASNGELFVWYTLNITTAGGGGLHDRLARFRVSSADPNVVDASSEQPLITQRDEASNHNGGQLLFGPDGYLYLSIGDEGGGNDQFENSQRIDKDFFSGVFRLDVDRRTGSLPPNPHPAVQANAYSIPADNPFVGATSFNGAPVSAAAVRTELWAVGLRNPWRMSFDPTTGQLWCGDVGQSAREEIDVIVRGGNYGWNYREGAIAGPRDNPPSGATLLPPIWDYPNPAQGSSVTGGLVYRGPRYPGLTGKYLFADFVSGRIWSLAPDGTNPVASDRVQLLATDGGISSFGLDPSNGDILLADLTENAIKRLVTGAGGNASFPATLSASGAFADVAALTPAAGVVAYEPRVGAWADYARVQRWFALPDTTSAFASVAGELRAPPGTVWLQHFDLELQRGDPTSARRVETRVLVLTNGGGAYALSYRWNDAQTDATLVPAEGANQVYQISEDGRTRPQTWRFPARAECLSCHVTTANADVPPVHYALGFTTRQLNRDNAFPGATANGLTALRQAGYLRDPIDPGFAPALALPDDPSAAVEARARAYLDANCSACHVPGRSAPNTWNADSSFSPRIARLVGGAPLDDRGDAANRLIAPGDIAHSQLLARMAGTRAPHMPPIAINERDRAGEQLLVDWIVSLAPNASAAPGPLTNLAARASVDATSNELIAGFVVSPGPTKNVLLRAVGPRLADFGVIAPLAEPMLTIFRDGRTIATNARWATAPNASALGGAAAQVGAFSLPEGSADSAALLSLASGAYTAQVTPAGGAGGAALLELYDEQPRSGSRLRNASIRARVAADTNVVIPGFVIGPGGAKTLLVRAVGPGLRDFGIDDFLATPVLDVFAGAQDFAHNAGWTNSARREAIREAARAVGAFALAEDGHDSALLLTLSPGAYTLQVSGADGTSGVTLIEIYEVP